MRAHPFVPWMVARHGKDDTPLGDFARELNRSWEFPRSGDHAELREFLSNMGCDEWVLACFDVGWGHWGARTCAVAECPAKAAGGVSLLCTEHTLGDLL